MENTLKELGIDQTLGPREIEKSKEEQYERIVMGELSIVFDEGGRKSTYQLNT